MATAAPKIEYASRVTYGSVAYDLENGVRSHAIPEEWRQDTPYERPREEREARRKIRTKAVVRAKAQVNPYPKISPLTVMGFLVVSALIVCVLLAYVQLTEISAASTTAQTRLADLKQTEAQLDVDYENTFNLNDVEQYATYTLGMVKESQAVKHHMNLNAGDKAEIIADNSDSQKSTLEEIGSFLSSIMSYFK